MSQYRPFSETLAKAKKAEHAIADVFLRSGFQVQWNGRGSSHDMIVGRSRPSLIEVKDESNFEDGPNMCFECVQGKGEQEWSGIFKSDSFVMIHIFGPKVILYRTRPCMLWLITEFTSGRIQKKSFGDNGNGGMIVPKIQIATKPWGDEQLIEDIPKSRLFVGV